MLQSQSAYVNGRYNYQFQKTVAQLRYKNQIYLTNGCTPQHQFVLKRRAPPSCVYHDRGTQKFY